METPNSEKQIAFGSVHSKLLHGGGLEVSFRHIPMCGESINGFPKILMTHVRPDSHLFGMKLPSRHFSPSPANDPPPITSRAPTRDRKITARTRKDTVMRRRAMLPNKKQGKTITPSLGMTE